VHILNHQHSTLGKPWKQLSQYIFGFEAENEAMIGKGESYIQSHLNWQCDRAKTIKNTLGSNSGVSASHVYWLKLAKHRTAGRS
jgi:mannan endo-1,4-beta-mannosidase